MYDKSLIVEDVSKKKSVTNVSDTWIDTIISANKTNHFYITDEILVRFGQARSSLLGDKVAVRHHNFQGTE